MKKYRIFIIPIILFTLFIGCIIALATQANATGNKYIKSSIGNIYFETKGEGNKTVIFVHGLGCDMNSWKYQRGKINGVKEVYIDLPGFGKSEGDVLPVSFVSNKFDEVLSSQHPLHTLPENQSRSGFLS